MQHLMPGYIRLPKKMCSNINKYNPPFIRRSMKKMIKLSIALSLLIPALLTSCSDDDHTASPQVTSMTVSNATDQLVSLTEGDIWTASIALLPEEATDKEAYSYRYTSTNEQVFTVDANGKVTAAGVGEAALRVWSVNNTDMWTGCIVKVDARIYPVTSIDIPDEYKTYFIGVNRTFDLGAVVRVNPENATEPGVIFQSSDEMIAVVNEYGEVYTQALGDVDITVKAIDGSNVTATCQLRVRNVNYTGFDRTGWTVSTSHPYLPDGVVGGAPASLIDDVAKTCLVLVKPGKSTGGITVGADESVYFIIDMQQTRTFNFFRLTHRTDNTSANLRVNKVSVYGSQDGETFTELAQAVPIATNANEITVDLPDTASYRYFKMTYDGWGASGNTMQISNFNVGQVEFEE